MKHGMTGTRLYKIWHNMKQRCYNPKATKYSSYGGKGIVICDEWLRDFSSFQEWAEASGYRDPPIDRSRLEQCWHNLTISRIDKTQGYYPDNCRWLAFQENRMTAGDRKPMSRPQTTAAVP